MAKKWETTKKSKTVSNSKKYIQISQWNLLYFLTKWFIYPVNINENKNWLEENDLFYLFKNYIPFVSKKIICNWVNIDNIIFLEVDELKDIIDLKNDIWLYDWIIPFSKVSSIYIENKAVYESIITSNYNNIFIPKNKMKVKKINLEDKEIFDNKLEDKENDNIETLRDIYNNKNKQLWWNQMIKFIDEDIWKLFNTNNTSKSKEILISLDNYLEQKDKDINDKILLFINSLIYKGKNFEDKENLKGLWNEIKKIVKELNIPSDDKNISEFLKNLKSHIDTTSPSISDIITIEQNLYNYAILLFLILYKYWNEKLEIFDKYWLSLIKDKKIKILLSYLYWEYNGYNSLYSELKLNDDITNKLIHEWNKIDYKELVDKEIIVENKIKIRREKVIKDSNIIWDYEDFFVDKNNIDWYTDLENKLNDEIEAKDELQTKLNNETKAKDELQTRLNNETKAKDELQTKLDEEKESRKTLEKELQNIKNQLSTKENQLNKEKQKNEDLKKNIDQKEEKIKEFETNKEELLQYFQEWINQFKSNKTQNNESNKWADWNYTGWLF